MKKIIYIIVFTALAFGGCIKEFDPEGAYQQRGMLVVDGLVTSGESFVSLTRTMTLNEEFTDEAKVWYAEVFVESNDGDRFGPGEMALDGVYTVHNGNLDENKSYRFFIRTEDGVEYASEYLSPIPTPDITYIHWTKDGPGEPIVARITTEGDADGSRYYRWSYEERWEVQAELFANAGYMDGKLIHFNKESSVNTWNCWGYKRSDGINIASSEKFADNVIRDYPFISESPSDDRFSILYYLEVRQFAIRPEAYDYWSNVVKNVEQTGSLFSPMPSEMKGNITCLTKDEEVIGFVDVSMPVTYSRFFNPERHPGMYEQPEQICVDRVTEDPAALKGSYLYYVWDGGMVNPPRNKYAPELCVDCRRKPNASKEKPDWWPTDAL